MIRSKKYLFIVIGVFTLILLLGGITYAYFNYTRTGEANTLLVGQIYMNHTEGTAISLTNVIPESAEEARRRNDNTITIQITGLNESDNDVYYKLYLIEGGAVTGRDRIRDEFLRFDLVEILDNDEEKYIVYNEKFSAITNAILTKDRIEAGTTSSVTRTYRLRMWITDQIVVSDTEQVNDYTTSEFNELFASVKITAQGQFEEVFYYDSFGDALDAVNDGNYVSETDRSHAVAGIYTDSFDNTTNLVLYQDAEIGENYDIQNPVNINLYGYTVEDVGTDTQDMFLRFRDNVLIENGVIKGTYQDANHFYHIMFYGDTGRVNNIVGDFPLPVRKTNFAIAFNSYTNNNTVIENSNLNYSSFVSYGSGSYLKILNCEIEGHMSEDQNGYILLEDTNIYDNNRTSLILVYPGTTLEVINSTIFADSPGCYLNGASYYDYSCGIDNLGTLIFRSGYVFGTHSAVSASLGSKTYVYGGTFESTDHGGFYFSQGPTGVAYVENATISGINYPSRGRLRPNGTVQSSIEYNGQTYTLEESKVAFYTGGSSNADGSNTYLVNCTFSAVGGEYFVLRNDIHLNLYISGSNFLNTNTNKSIRVASPSKMKLYFGSNNDFHDLGKVNANGTKTFAEAIDLGIIVPTNQDYKGIIHPE